jgi:hypothetical protein
MRYRIFYYRGAVWAVAAASAASSEEPAASWLLVFKLLAFRRNDPRCLEVLGDIAPADRYVLTERDRAPRACPTRRVVAADAGLNPDRAPATIDRSPPGTLGAERGSASDPAREPDAACPDILRRSARRPAPWAWEARSGQIAASAFAGGSRHPPAVPCEPSMSSSHAMQTSLSLKFFIVRTRHGEGRL